MDNYFKGCPPVMSDGRFASDFQTSTVRNEHIKHVNEIYRDDEYRTFLQQNGTKFMNNVWEHHSNNNKCWVNNCVHVNPTRAVFKDFESEKKNYESKEPKNQCKKYKDYTLNSQE